MLEHTSIKGYIVILTPTTKGVKQKDWVFVSLFHKLFTSIFKEKNVTIMEGVSNLEAINSICTTSSNLFNNLSWSKSKLVHTIIESNSGEEVCWLRRDKPVTLCKNGLRFRVFCWEGTEGTCANLFFSIFEESWLVQNSKDFFAMNWAGSKSNLRVSF